MSDHGAAALVYPYFPYSAEHSVTGITLDRDDTVIASDNQHLIGKIADHTWLFLAGNGGGFVNGKARAACFNQPTGIAVDARGMIYVADSGNNAIRVINRFAKEEPRPQTKKIRR